MMLATELLHKSLWYPTILGVLVVVSAVVLFMGSIYLLLGTNLGARLGFLVTFTCLFGFLMILSLLWTTTASPLNTLKGRIPQWKVQQVVENIDQAKKETARTIVKKANEADTTESSNVKAAVDAALVTKSALPTAPLGPDDNKFALPAFTDVTKYEILGTWEIGGSHPQFWKGQFTHSEQLAVVQFCETAPVPADRAFGLPPLPPECADGGQTGYVVLTRDLGSLRFPPFIAFVSFSILFVLGLLMLHWRERDEQDAEAAAAASTPAPERVPAEV
ncbi:MAG: hypothetical protein ACHQDE_01820 [Acidimicrobiia bacterium]